MYSDARPRIALPRRSQLGAANVLSQYPILSRAQSLRFV